MRVVATLCLMVTLAGEAHSDGAMRSVAKVGWAPFRYVGGRVQDLLDVFELNVGVGRGVKLDVKYGIHFFGVGDLLGTPGLDSLKVWRVGNIDRRVGVWRELDTEFSIFPFSLLAWPVHRAARWCGWRRLANDAKFVYQAGTEGVQYLDRKELNGDVEFFWKDTVEGYRHTRWGDSFPIGAEVQAGLGARAMFRPLQFVDFVLGFVFIDLDPWLTATE